MRAFILAVALVLVSLSQPSSSSPNPAFSSARCSPAAFTDPYAGVPAAIAASSSSSFYVTASASSVLIYSTSIPAFNTSAAAPAPVSFTSIPSPCFTYAALNLSFSPSYARYLDLQQNVLAVGSPSKDLSSASPASFIDVVQLSLNASGAINASSTQTLYASDTPFLGLSFALSDDAQYLAAYYTADAFVIFHPVWNRSQPQYNTATDSDVMLQYPADFYADSFELHLPYLAVTGMTTTSGVAAVPTLLLYVSQSIGGVWSNWTLSSSLALAQQLPAAAAANTLPIASMSLPSNALPVAFTATASSPILVGVPALETVFITALPSPSLSSLFYLQNNAAASQLSLFACDVKLSDDASTAFVLSQQGLVTFSTASLLAAACSPDNATGAVDVLLTADSIAPNRFQYSTAAAVAYVAVATSAALTVLLPSPASLSSPFLLPATAAAIYYDNVIGQFAACPPGSYRAASAAASASPCSFCPVNSYSSQPGSTSCLNCTDGQYCPAGSTFPFNTSVVSREHASDIPEFESESFADSFEDLLINAIFNPDTVPVIMAIVLAGVTLLAVACYVAFEGTREYVKPVLWLYRFALMPNEEEEKEKENEVKGILTELLEQREKAQPVYKCPHAVLAQSQAEAKQAAATAAQQRDDSPYVQPSYASLPGSSLLFAREKSSSGAGEEKKEEETEGEAGGSAQSRQRKAEQAVSEETKLQEEIMKGFFNILMLLFGISCVVFSWTYLNNYQPDAVSDDETNNRYRTEELVSVTVTDDVEVLGLNAINAVNATILTLLIGYSGIACDSSALLGLQLDGCIIQQTNGLCNQSAFISVYESPHLPNTCTIEFQLVQGTLLALMAVMTVSLPPSLQVQATRFVFLQDAQQSYPEDFVVTGPTTFYDTATHPADADGNLIPNALAPRVQRDWVFGILAQGEQIDENTPPTFSYVWYNTVTSLNTPWLPTLPLTAYSSSQQAAVQLVLTMQTETFFRLQLTQKLIEKKAAFLTILLGLIAIFHVIEFGKQVVELALLVMKKIRKNRALKAVSALSKEATDKMGAVVKAGVENLASVSPLQLHKRVATSSAAELEHSSRAPLGTRLGATQSGLPPPTNPQYSATSYQPAYPPAAGGTTVTLSGLPVSASYPAAYPAVSAALPSSMLPYPMPMPNQLDVGSSSRGHSRGGSRDARAGGNGDDKFMI